MGIGWLFVLLAVLWALQLGLAYQQAQHFMARARALRRLGRVSIGASPRRLRGRAYVAVAVGPDARPVPALVGLAAAELAAGTQVPDLHLNVQAAAQSAAAALHPELPGAPEPTGQRPHRRRRPRGGIATS
jgi:DNA-binding transcriptional regulator of glucitol operon